MYKNVIPIKYILKKKKLNCISLTQVIEIENYIDLRSKSVSKEGGSFYPKSYRKSIPSRFLNVVWSRMRHWLHWGQMWQACGIDSMHVHVRNSGKKKSCRPILFYTVSLFIYLCFIRKIMYSVYHLLSCFSIYFRTILVFRYTCKS